MTFSQMTNPQIRTWIDWCQDHDWGATARFDGACICVGGEAFETPSDLRAWAGY